MRKDKVKAKKKALRGEMQSKAGVHGLGIGAKKNGEEVLAVFVAKKADGAGIPEFYELEDGSKVATEIVEIGEVKFTGFLGKYRPVQPGAVIGNPNGQYDGTVGAIVTDNVSGEDVILGASHVLANFNQASLGDPIVQPSTQQGGALPTDRIGTLERYVHLNLEQGGVNYADAAIVMPDSDRDIRDRSFCSPINLKKNAAVGLVYAASPAITIVNPVDFVESELNVSFSKKVAPTVGMSIHMCAAYSGYQTTNISYINADIWVNYNGNQILWEDQIVTPPVGTSGDSGAVFYTTFNA